MAKRSPWASVEEHFASRHRPYGRNVDLNARNRIEREPKFETGNARGAFNRPDVQDVEDRPDFSKTARYNDAPDDWRKGGNEDATGKPSFDKSNAWRMKDSNDWHSTTQADKVEFVKPERVTANKKQMRDGG